MLSFQICILLITFIIFSISLSRVNQSRGGFVSWSISRLMDKLISKSQKLTHFVVFFGLISCGTSSLVLAQTSPGEEQVDPSIRKVQKVALQYAALNPEIFKSMRSRSRIQAALPQVTIRATKDQDNESRSLTRFGETELAQDISATKVVGDDLQLYAEARWKLSETVFNYQETAVMRENRYSAKERQKLLQTVTQTYFERKRTLIKLKKTKSGTQPHELLVLKLMQIEAELDALTGGWFTQQINAARLGE